MRACLFFLWSPLAFSAEHVVLHSGENPTLAASQVHASAGLDDQGLTPADLQTRTLSDVVAGESPVLKGTGSVSVCGTSPTTLASLRQAVERSEDAVSYMETEQAVAHLRTGVSTLKCLGEAVHPEVGGRLFYLQGIVLHSLENETGARMAFSKALSYLPDLSWDEYFAPNAQPLFEEIKAGRAETPVLPLQVIPEPPEGGLWVDGRPVELSDGRFQIQEGEHLVQLLGTATIQLRIAPLEEEGIHSLILPQATRTQDLIWVNDEERRDVLSTVLDSTLPEGTHVYAVSAGRVWARSPADGNWTELEVKGNFGSMGRSSRLSLPQTLLWGGTGLALGGTTLLAISRGQMQQAADLLSGSQTFTEEEINTANSEYNSAGARYIVGAAIGVTGLAMVSGSFFLGERHSFQPGLIHVPETGSWSFHIHHRW